MPSGGAANLRRQVKGAMSGTKKVEGGAKTPATSYAVGRSGAVKGCRVPGCTVADLSGASRYCLRHRICEEHLKSLSVNFDSKPHRFCQKCTRFHDVTEFDNLKHSCRAALQLRKHRLLTKKLAERQAAAQQDAAAPAAKAARTSKTQSSAKAKKAAAAAAEAEATASPAYEDDDDDDEEYVDADYKMPVPAAVSAAAAAAAGPMFPWMHPPGMGTPGMGVSKLGMTQPHRPKPIDAVALHGGRASASASPVGGMSACSLGLGLSRAASPWAPPAPWLQHPAAYVPAAHGDDAHGSMRPPPGAAWMSSAGGAGAHPMGSPPKRGLSMSPALGAYGAAPYPHHMPSADAALMLAMQHEAPSGAALGAHHAGILNSMLHQGLAMYAPHMQQAAAAAAASGSRPETPTPGSLPTPEAAAAQAAQASPYQAYQAQYQAQMMSMLHHSVSALYSPSPSPSPAPDALRSYMHAPRLPGMPTGLGAPPWDTLFGHGSEWVGAKPEPDVGAQQGAEEEASEGVRSGVDAVVVNVEATGVKRKMEGPPTPPEDEQTVEAAAALERTHTASAE